MKIEFDKAFEAIALAWVDDNQVVNEWLETRYELPYSLPEDEIEDYLMKAEESEVMALYYQAGLDK